MTEDMYIVEDNQQRIDLFKIIMDSIGSSELSLPTVIGILEKVKYELLKDE